MPGLQTKSAVHDPELVYENIYKIRTSRLLCGCTDDAQRHLGIGSGCSVVRLLSQPDKKLFSQGSGLDRDTARGRKGQKLCQLV